MRDALFCTNRSFTAASYVQRAADFLNGLGGEPVEAPDQLGEAAYKLGALAISKYNAIGQLRWRRSAATEHKA